MAAFAASRRPLAVFLLLAAVTLALDQLTKALAAHLASPICSRPLLGGWLRLTLGHNRGVMFGLFPSNWFWLLVGPAICLAVLWYVTRGGALTHNSGQAVGLGLMFGGALGNVTDRLRLGAVVDFIDVWIWPQFNLADTALVAGAVLLIVRLLKTR
jgi:signal peptidase II